MNTPCPSALTRVQSFSSEAEVEGKICMLRAQVSEVWRKNQTRFFFPSQLRKMENIGPHREFLR